MDIFVLFKNNAFHLNLLDFEELFPIKNRLLSKKRLLNQSKEPTWMVKVDSKELKFSHGVVVVPL